MGLRIIFLGLLFGQLESGDVLPLVKRNVGGIVAGGRNQRLTERNLCSSLLLGSRCSQQALDTASLGAGYRARGRGAVRDRSLHPGTGTCFSQGRCWHGHSECQANQ